MSCPAGTAPSLPVGGTMQRMFCVNRWQSVPVYQNRPYTTPNQQIGTIAYNDYFRWEWEWYFSSGSPGEHCVLIRNSSGQLQWGYIAGWDIDVNKGLLFSAIVNFQLASFSWNGLNLREFRIQNRSAQLRASNGSLIETLPVGTRIAANSSLPQCVMGQTYCAYWRIAAVYRDLGIAGVPPQWYWADMGNSTYAFVDTGLPANRPGTSTIRTSLA